MNLERVVRSEAGGIETARVERVRSKDKVKVKVAGKGKGKEGSVLEVVGVLGDLGVSEEFGDLEVEH